MLIRISLIVAIIAGLAVGALNFTKLKEKIVTLQTNLKTEIGLKETALRDLASTRSDLKKTEGKLKQTETMLAATTEERDTALKNLDTKTKLADKLKTDLDKTTKDLDDARGELAAYTGTGLKPEEIIAINKQYKGLQDQLAEGKLVITSQGKQIQRLTNELAVYRSGEDYKVRLPAGLKGKVLVMDPKWNFVVLNVGEDQGVLEHGELLVNRNGRLVAKVRIRSVQKDRCIANIMPGWQLGDVLEGDLVIPAYPAS